MEKIKSDIERSDESKDIATVEDIDVSPIETVLKKEKEGDFYPVHVNVAPIGVLILNHFFTSLHFHGVKILRVQFDIVQMQFIFNMIQFSLNSLVCMLNILSYLEF